MGSQKLVVEVVSANSLSDNLDLLNPCVELRFAGRSFTTSVKRNVRCPIWNESFLFNVVDRDYLLKQALEAYVYNVTDDSRSFLGKVRLSGTTIIDDSSNEVVKDYQLMRSGILQRSKGVLLLKLLLKDEPAVQNSDPLSAVNPFTSLREAVRESLRPMDDNLKEIIAPSFEHGRLIEHMPFIFVRVAKARHLPDVDATGGLDPYVEVKIGDYIGTTDYLQREQNPEWNTTFAFSKLQMDRDLLTRIYVVVNDKDIVKDEFVGMVMFDLGNIPQRSPFDKPLPPEWYPLVDESGRVTEGELMLAIWSGSQTDEAFSDARKSDSFHIDNSTMSHISPKLYDSPNLWYVRITILEFTCIALHGAAKVVDVNAMMVLGNQRLKTRRSERRPLANHVWNEEFMFVAAEPFEDDLQVSVQACHVGSRTMKVIGQISLPLETLRRRVDDHLSEPHWFDLQMPPEFDDTEDDFNVSSCKILISAHLEGGYNVSYDPASCIDDTRPADKQCSNPPVVGLLEVGILGADKLPSKERRNGNIRSHPYCVAKYGRKWARTRTIINSCNPVFNEQYTWDVYDTSTVLTIGVFDNDQLEDYSSNEGNSTYIGKVRIRLSNLEPDRIYAHSYPLLNLLLPSGVKKMGELRLAVRFSLTSSLVNMLHMYSSPILPRMHYDHPLSVLQRDILQNHANMIVAARLSRMEPPLSREIVSNMCDQQAQLWSIRKSKANFFRIMSVLSGLIMLCKWFDNVCRWKNPGTTLLVHFVFVVALLFDRLVAPSVLLILFSITLRNYRYRPRHPPNINIKFSMLDKPESDELDEEYDTFPTTRSPDLVRMRYDRLRSVAGRVQQMLGDVASWGEKIQALTSWRDPIATGIFGLSTLAAAIVLYFVPWKLLVAVLGIYTMRHPMFRRTTPSFLISFLRRLPHRGENLL